MSNRNSNRVIRTNGAEIYRELLETRGLKKVKQFTTPVFNQLTASKIKNVQKERHMWSPGDRLCKLAARYYGDPEMWWLIAWYNQKPTDSHIRLGDTVLIPLPLSEIMGLYYSSNAR